MTLVSVLDAADAGRVVGLAPAGRVDVDPAEADPDEGGRVVGEADALVTREVGELWVAAGRLEPPQPATANTTARASGPRRDLRTPDHPPQR